MTESWLFPSHLSGDQLLQNRGLFWGENPFTCFLLKDGQPRFFEDHWQRISSSASYCFEGKFKADQFRQFILSKLNAVAGLNGLYYCRITFFETFEGELACHFLVKEFEQAETARLRVELSQKIKYGDYPNFVKLGRHSEFLHECKARECDDIIYLDPSGLLLESGRANIFWKSGKTVFTPSLIPGVLEGVTRKHLIKCLIQNKIEVVEGSFELSALQAADEVWLTNSLKGLHQVGQFGEHVYLEQDSIFNNVQRYFEDYCEGLLER
ncbi:MAG: aminotransferase class IV [Halobacteriovoraceae bacterium]|jgi:branched-subunit amino acid aminotransferase/4-amino-4-deoxychorismate lyase|nr:aminotransferase class IV [Halobacteriovoraceae bacterium]MBT5094453.1 aminotransferase class IV [Halobacteriovoraceae bacterium]